MKYDCIEDTLIVSSCFVFNVCVVDIINLGKFTVI